MEWCSFHQDIPLRWLHKSKELEPENCLWNISHIFSKLLNWLILFNFIFTLITWPRIGKTELSFAKIEAPNPLQFMIKSKFLFCKSLNDCTNRCFTCPPNKTNFFINHGNSFVVSQVYVTKCKPYLKTIILVINIFKQKKSTNVIIK